MPLFPTYNHQTIALTVEFSRNSREVRYIRSYLLNVRKIKYVNTSCSTQTKDTKLYIVFTDYSRPPCAYVTLFYYLPLSNMMGRQHDEETINDNKFERKDLIRSILIDIKTCSSDKLPLWRLRISRSRSMTSALNSTHYNFLPDQCIIHGSYFLLDP